MYKKIKQHVKQNNGDVYIQMLLCTTVLLLISVIIISVASSINTKLWLDEQLNDIVRLVETTGRTESAAISAIEDSITDRLGGQITYHGEFIAGAEGGRVQLNDTVYVNYYCDQYVAVNIAFFPISTEINLTKAATSNVYYKTSNYDS